MPSIERGPRPQERTSEIARVLENMGRFDHALSASERVYKALDYMQIRDANRRSRLHAQTMGVLEHKRARAGEARAVQHLADARRHEKQLVGSGDDAAEIMGA